MQSNLGRLLCFSRGCQLASGTVTLVTDCQGQHSHTTYVHTSLWAAAEAAYLPSIHAHPSAAVVHCAETLCRRTEHASCATAADADHIAGLVVAPISRGSKRRSPMAVPAAQVCVCAAAGVALLVWGLRCQDHDSTLNPDKHVSLPQLRRPAVMLAVRV